MANKKHLPIGDALSMIGNYAKSRIVAQIKSVAFIILYLVFFQVAILQTPLANALGTAGGIALVVFGLAFFLEGLVLGMMPIGERVGVKLPAKVGIVPICIFGIVLGFGSTLAEPAISSLKTAGATITAWDSPLLYMILDKYSGMLVNAVGAGVGLAVALGMCRFYYNWNIKPIIFVVIPLVMVLTLYASFNDNLSKIIGLAWDCGAVTTGAVTVPLVLALGIGVSRAANQGGGSNGGFGIIMLASAFPIAAVLGLGLYLNTMIPAATTESAFFAPENKNSAVQMFNGDESAVAVHAFTHGSEAGRRALFGGDSALFDQTILAIAHNDSVCHQYLGNEPLSVWLAQRASNYERNLLSTIDIENTIAIDEPLSQTLKEETASGLRAVIPLTLLLIIVLTLFLRERIRNIDEVVTGLVFTLVGMILLTSGIKLGLGSLGGEVGSQLPKAFASEEKFVEQVVINNFDTTLLYKGITSKGESKTFFNMYERGDVKPIEFNPDYYDAEKQTYTQIVTEKPLFDSKLSVLGLILVLVFAFGLGYGATLAEPALNALGITVEDISVGAIKRKQIVQVVSVGVGMGIVLGLSRILFDLPLVWLIMISYGLLLLLTIFSDDSFAAIAWDSGGVTTGPVTVPLVLALGLGIGGALNISDGFGILAMASAWPIITVLTFGIYSNLKQHSNLKNTENE